MNIDTLAALKEAIDSYKRLRTATKAEILEAPFDPQDCPLCKLHLRDGKCNGCPVNDAGYPGCYGTARMTGKRHDYCGWLNLASARRYLMSKSWTSAEEESMVWNIRRRCRKYAKFLKSLLPND